MEITEKIKGQLGNWWPLFKDFIESPKWDDIFTNLKMQSQAHRVLIPKAPDLFRSFEYTDKDKVKCVIFLMDPYPTFNKDNVMIADGVPMSCKNTGTLQPSLQLFYNAIEDTYLNGFEPDFDARADNSYLLKEEHVLLLNTALSVEKDKVGSHGNLWAPFMKYFIEEVLNKNFRGLPIILCGQTAQKLERYFNPMIHYIKKVEHPAAAAHSNRLWKYENVFQWIDNIIQNNNGASEKIRWHRLKSEQVKEEELPDWVTDGTIMHHESEGKPPLPKAQDLGLPWRDD